MKIGTERKTSKPGQVMMGGQGRLGRERGVPSCLWEGREGDSNTTGKWPGRVLTDKSMNVKIKVVIVIESDNSSLYFVAMSCYWEIPHSALSSFFIYILCIHKKTHATLHGGCESLCDRDAIQEIQLNYLLFPLSFEVVASIVSGCDALLRRFSLSRYNCDLLLPSSVPRIFGDYYFGNGNTRSGRPCPTPDLLGFFFSLNLSQPHCTLYHQIVHYIKGHRC